MVLFGHWQDEEDEKERVGRRTSKRNEEEEEEGGQCRMRTQGGSETEEEDGEKKNDPCISLGIKTFVDFQGGPYHGRGRGGLDCRLLLLTQDKGHWIQSQDVKCDIETTRATKLLSLAKHSEQPMAKQRIEPATSGLASRPRHTHEDDYSRRSSGLTTG